VKSQYLSCACGIRTNVPHGAVPTAFHLIYAERVSSETQHRILCLQRLELYCPKSFLEQQSRHSVTQLYRKLQSLSAFHLEDSNDAMQTESSSSRPRIGDRFRHVYYSHLILSLYFMKALYTGFEILTSALSSAFLPQANLNICYHILVFNVLFKKSLQPGCEEVAANIRRPS
jgi:hypothetical protein